jgi:hypothetical protein
MTGKINMEKHILNRVNTLNRLEKLAASPDSPSRTLYFPPRLPRAMINDMLKEISAEPPVSAQLAEVVNASPNGAVIFWGNEVKCVIVPPFPIGEKSLTFSLDVAPMRVLLARDYHIGVVLVRLGSYAIGVCRGEKLITSKVGTGLVHGRHRQGGSSSHRFERHRDKQIEQFLIRVCGHAREQLEPYARTLDFMAYGGARTTILMAQKYCPFLMKLDKPVLPPLLDIPEPRQAVLESTIERMWSSTIYEWRED